MARAIHDLSSRARGPFVAVNCGSLTDQLFEEELFGHERGTFTDAHSQRSGLVVEARGGTLFLDEIDALARKSRVSILRLLQDKSFRAIGRGTEEHADIRILAATGESAIEHIANIPAMRLRAALERASQPMVKNIELDSSSVQGSNPLLRISGYNLTRGITPSVRIGGEQVAVVKASEREIFVRPGAHQLSGMLEVETVPGSVASADLHISRNGNDKPYSEKAA